jgi:hypothetical protein
LDRYLTEKDLSSIAQEIQKKQEMQKMITKRLESLKSNKAASNKDQQEGVVEIEKQKSITKSKEEEKMANSAITFVD